ncbi:hypothetical protein HY839_00990 [Candidatus Azambacteria bacterium]|nr:hypothetical protein [Candidatus Azambacteria bacterium]
MSVVAWRIICVALIAIIVFNGQKASAALIPFTADTNIAQHKIISAGGSHSLALKSDGTVWGWGWNGFGQLGNGTTISQSIPVQSKKYDGTHINNIVAISAGLAHSLALKSDGTVWAWGRGNSGQLGNGTLIFYDGLAKQVPGLNNIAAIAAGGNYSLALKSDGTVWGWGANYYGQLGDGTTTQQLTPIQVYGLTGIVALAAGDYHSLALKSDGTVWGWGYNFVGQLGDGTAATRLIPVQVKGLGGTGFLTDVIAITTGQNHSLALKSDRTLWGWGRNDFGQLGDGTTNHRYTPIQSTLIGITVISAKTDYSFALKSDGTVWGWGLNFGYLGIGTNSYRETLPVQVIGLTEITALATGSGHSLALKSDGTVWGWGENSWGQIGDGTAATRLIPVQVLMEAPLDIIPPDTVIISTIDGENNSIVNNGTTTSDSITLTFGGSDNVGIAGFECGFDNGTFISCVNPITLTNLSRDFHIFQVRAKDTTGNIDPTPPTFLWRIMLPQQFWSEIQNANKGLGLRTTPGTINKPANDILKVVPNNWAIKVIGAVDANGNNVDVDNYRWYKVEDMTDGTIGWMEVKNLSSGAVYLAYDPNSQADLQNKAAVQLSTAEQRKSIVLDAVDVYYTNPNTVDSLYGGGGGKDGLNNFQGFINGAAFPKELILSIAAQESGLSSNNEICSGAKDGGIGIMQITSPDLKGLGSGLDNIQKKYDCDAKTGWIGNFSKYYSNALQGIYANIKDGFRALQGKYRQKCPGENAIISGYTFTCQDIEKILTTWGYNGFAKDKATGLYTGNYLKYIADKLRNLNTYFAGIIYPNTDNLVEKLEVANNNKQVIRLYSPAVLQIVDTVGNITGVTGDIVHEDITNSLYEKDAEGAVIFFPHNRYRYRVIGTATGTYGFTVDFTKNGILKTFRATGIPITTGEIHEYLIDWDALDRGERGVTVSIDYNGDGITDQIIISDSVLTDIEPPFISAIQLDQEYLYGSPLQIWFSATDSVSGIVSVTATINGIEITNDQILVFDKPGTNVFQVIAVDNDGNQTTLTQTFEVILGATLRIEPKTLNLSSKGKYIEVGIRLPEPYDIADITVATIRLNGAVPAIKSEIEVENEQGVLTKTLKVKFVRTEAQKTVIVGKNIVLVSGNLNDGTRFKGTDILTVINQPHKKLSSFFDFFLTLFNKFSLANILSSFKIK